MGKPINKCGQCANYGNCYDPAMGLDNLIFDKEFSLDGCQEWTPKTNTYERNNRRPYNNMNDYLCSDRGCVMQLCEFQNECYTVVEAWKKETV